MGRRSAMLILKYDCEETPERIELRKKWLQVCLHSIIYYRYDNNIWTDQQWDETAREVVKLKNENPGLVNSMPFRNDLKVFDGSTGFNLSCMQDIKMLRWAQNLLDFHVKRGLDGKSKKKKKRRRKK